MANKRKPSEDHFLLKGAKDRFNRFTHSVAFIDIVGFTKGQKSNEDLYSDIKKFEEKFWFVFDPDEFWGDKPTDKNYQGNTLIVIPTGDGVAIGFSPEIQDTDVLKYVLALYKRITKEGIVVRIGINRGENYVTRDLNHHENLVGWGIIHAQRIMDIAEKNQILCSASFAQPLDPARRLDGLMHIGYHKIKHGEEIDLYNYVKEGEFGNSKSPVSKY